MKQLPMSQRFGRDEGSLLAPGYDMHREIHRLLVYNALPIALIGIYLFWCWRFWSFTIDDAYISARYARNLAQGLGLVYNPGERVMGFTSLLLTLLEALVYRAGGDGLFVAKVIGVLSGLGVLGLTARITRTMGGSTGTALAAMAFLAVYPALPISAVMGLETTLFAFLVLLIVFLMLQRPEPIIRPRNPLLLGITFGLATLTRPEGLGVALVFLTLALLRWGQQRPLSLRRLSPVAVWLSVYAAILIPTLIGLWAYYGSPVPNTFYAKTAAGWMPNQYFAGFIYWILWLKEPYNLLLIPCFLWGMHSPHIRSRGALAALIASYGAYLIYVGGDWMPGHRLLMPIAPLYYILALLGLEMAWRSWCSRWPRLRRIWQVAPFALFALLALLSYGETRTVSEHIQARARGYARAHLWIAHWLRENTPSHASVALMDIGLIGYISERWILDITGLTSREIARIAHQGGGWARSSEEIATQVAQFVLAQKPDLIILAHVTPSLDPEHFAGWIYDTAIFRSPAFADQYEHLFTVKHLEDYYLSLFRRADLDR